VQQAVRVERVPDAAVGVVVEIEAELRSGVEPYFFRTCSKEFSPSGGMSGLSSKGWRWISAATSSPTAARAFISDLSPITHHGQATSETKSIRRGLAISVSFASHCRRHAPFSKAVWPSPAVVAMIKIQEITP
jgi:hypothetical protein